MLPAFTYTCAGADIVGVKLRFRGASIYTSTYAQAIYTNHSECVSVICTFELRESVNIYVGVS